MQYCPAAIVNILIRLWNINSLTNTTHERVTSSAICHEVSKCRSNLVHEPTVNPPPPRGILVDTDFLLVWYILQTFLGVYFLQFLDECIRAPQTHLQRVTPN